MPDRRRSRRSPHGSRTTAEGDEGRRIVDLKSLADDRVLNGIAADVGISRERTRQRRLAKLAVVAIVAGIWVWVRVLNGHAPWPGLPHLSGKAGGVAPLILLVVILGAVLLGPLLMAGRSPHILLR